jgi:hypothetical protein
MQSIRRPQFDDIEPALVDVRFVPQRYVAVSKVLDIHVSLLR